MLSQETTPRVILAVRQWNMDIKVILLDFTTISLKEFPDGRKTYINLHMPIL